MKYFALFTVLVVCLAVLLGSANAAFCPCDLANNKEKVCGSNGVTYTNRCEFECTQRDYKRLGRTLNVAKTGAC